MPDVDKARLRFKAAGLPFPAVPTEFKDGLEYKHDSVFATRNVDEWPYSSGWYVEEFLKGDVPDYLLLGFAGHDPTSKGVQYFLVRQGLGLFLHLGLGNVGFFDSDDETHWKQCLAEEVEEITRCFALADKVVAAAEHSAWLEESGPLMVFASTFGGSEWKAREASSEDSRLRPSPVGCLQDVLRRLQEGGPRSD